MLLVDEEDLVVLCSKLKLFQSKLLRKWVQGLDTEQRAAAFMKDTSVVNKHSTSLMMIVLLLFLQKQSLAFAVYLFGIGTLHTGPGLKKKHM